MVLLEHTAGQGRTLGHRFEHLAAIIERVNGSARVGVCLDTCHLVASGYDIVSDAGYRDTFEAFDRIVGFDRLRVFHGNDSKKPCGSRVDRHEHIGQGCLGLEPFRRLLHDPRFSHLPILIETEKSGNTKPHAIVVDRIRHAEPRHAALPARESERFEDPSGSERPERWGIFPRMSRATFLRLFVTVFVLQGAWAVYTQTAKPPGPLRTERVKGDLHMISGEGGNVALYATSDGVVLVDDMFDRNHADILAQVRTVTDKPLKYVINTHQHDDHAGGDFKMLPIAEVIAHRNVYANLKDLKRPYYEDTPGTPIGLPRITFTDQLDVHVGGKDVQAYYFGRAHTSGDAVIYFPELRTIHTGDLFLAIRAGGRGAAPAQPRPPGVPIYVDYVQGGSFIEWSKTLEGALKLDFDTVIPGHGPVSTKADLVKFKSDLETMRGRLTGLIKQGSTKAQIVKILEDDYGWRSTGCPPSPPTPGCLQYQQVDALIAELGR